MALDIKTGQLKWKTYTVPQGYYGGSVWGSTGAVDTEKNLLFMPTGNNWAVPQSVLDCLSSGQSKSSCVSPDNHADSIIALDLDTGAIKWAFEGVPRPLDVSNVACGLNVPGFTIDTSFPGVYANCPFPGNPAGEGPDWDFAQGPILLDDGLVGAGQKSGVFFALKRRTGEAVWQTQVAPGGETGGMQWGSSYDGERIFVAESNSGNAQNPAGTPWTLKNGSTTTGGGWAALDPKTGAVLWTTPDPNGSRAESPVSSANGVVFGCDLAYGVGTMVALDAKNGAILWSYNSGGVCNAGASISDGVVYWGSGRFSNPASGPQKLFAFALPRGVGDD